MPNPAGNSKELDRKNGNFDREGGLKIMEFQGNVGGGGSIHFGISEGKEGLQYGSRPYLGMDIFWNRPLISRSKLLVP